MGGKTFFCGPFSTTKTSETPSSAQTSNSCEAFSHQTLWDTLMERTIHRFDQMGAERYVCELLGDNGRSGLIFTSWKKFIAHKTHNKGGNHSIKSPLRVAVITNQCVDCGSTFADRSTAQNHSVNSWSRCTCRTDRSHMTWSLEEVTQPITCNPCEQEFWGSAAPTFRGSRHAQHLRQPRRNRQHARNGHEREPRRDGSLSSKIEGSSDEPPAEPSETEEPAAPRQWWRSS